MRSKRFGLAVALALSAWPGAAAARYPEIHATLGAHQMVGAARYQVLAWPVFDAELWSARGAFSWDQPFALSLTYRRDITEADLIARSLRGIETRTGLAATEELASVLRECFADVRAGDRLTGVSVSRDEARFFLNGRQTCALSWPGFRRAFFGIWLDARGADSAFSARLTGAAAPRLSQS